MLIRDEPAPAESPLLAQQARTRDERILEHLPQVKLIAKQIGDRLPVSVSLEDLISAGIFGLIAAIDRYDPKQRVKLKTFAEYKIRGAILDSLRNLDWAPRQNRRRARIIETAIAKLEQTLQRRPSENEIAAELGLPVEQYREWLNSIASLRMGSLEQSNTEEGEGRSLQYRADPDSHSPAQLVERVELESMLASVLEKLPVLEKTVLHLYFYEELTLREIGRIVGLHESRVSQLKSQAILRLRAAVASPHQLSRSGGGGKLSVSSL